MSEFEVRQQSFAALGMDIFKVAGGGVRSPFVLPAKAGLTGQVGGACRWTGLSSKGIRSVNDAQK
jgi:hypothetical protein